MKQPKRIKINGKYYKLIYSTFLGENVQGKVDCPDSPGKELRIKLGQSNEDHAESICHELLHIHLWDLEEEKIERMAHDIAVLLKKCGLIKD